jgi:hypothetical protein
VDGCGAGAGGTDPLDEGTKGDPAGAGHNPTPPTPVGSSGYQPEHYVAEVIGLNRRPVIRIRSVTAHGWFLVGYFASVESINDHGGPIDLADLRIE